MSSLPTLVLITGTGRSGTSTMSGTLHHLGLSVPGPYLGANKSNPKGFFESKWSVDFHKSFLRAAHVDDFDGHPNAFDRAQQAITADVREQLQGFLAEHADETQLVVKDPRTVWAQRVWRDAAVEAGREVRFISMLRHPAEVIASRTTYYAKNSEDDAKRRRYETVNVARWINNSIISERETRGERRAFVRYTDLLEDWRPVAKRLADELGLTYDVDLDSGAPTPVDDFIDPGLRRHGVGWDEHDVPDRLREIADAVWADVERLGESGGVDESSSADLDEQAVAYHRVFTEAAAISHDAAEASKAAGRDAGVREGRQRAKKRAAARGVTIDQASGRELLRAAVRRAKSRMLGKGSN